MVRTKKKPIIGVTKFFFTITFWVISYNSQLNCFLETKVSNEANGTISKLNLTPAIEDDGRIVTCRAQTPLLAGGFVEDEWRMQVYCKYSRDIRRTNMNGYSMQDVICFCWKCWGCVGFHLVFNDQSEARTPEKENSWKFSSSRHFNCLIFLILTTD